MTDNELMKYWETQKTKTKDILLVLKNIKKEMNVQSPKKVLEKYINIYEEGLDEAIEAYEYYLDKQILERKENNNGKD